MLLHFAVISFIKYLVKFSHQEKLQQEGEKYLQSKEDLRLMLTDLRKKQEAGFALQHGLQEKKAQLKIYKKFLQKAQDLTSLLKELKSQGNYLLECTKNPSFSEEPWLEIKHLHESLLQQLQVKSTRKILNDLLPFLCKICIWNHTNCLLPSFVTQSIPNLPFFMKMLTLPISVAEESIVCYLTMVLVPHIEVPFFTS
jgi:hypothetical protein